jgi:NitT/TauT family transport system substrate-binding protein
MAGLRLLRPLVRKDLVDSGRYKSFQDLKGMKIAVGTFGSANARR